MNSVKEGARVSSQSFQLKPRTEIVERENNLILIESFGNFIYLRHALINEDFMQLWNLLEKEPQNLATLQIALPQLTLTRIEDYLDFLNKQNFLQEINESAAPVDSKFQFLSEFFSSSTAISKCVEKAKSKEILILDGMSMSQLLLDQLEKLEVKKVKSVSLESASTHELEQADFIVALSSWNQSAELETLNAALFQLQKPWLLTLSDPMGGQVGPLFSGQDSPCFSCLRQRKASLLEAGSQLKFIEKNFFSKTRAQAPESFFPLSQETLVQFATVEIFKFLSELPSPRVKRGALILDSFNLKLQFHELFPVPFCEVCLESQNRPFGNLTAGQ